MSHLKVINLVKKPTGVMQIHAINNVVRRMVLGDREIATDRRIVGDVETVEIVIDVHTTTATDIGTGTEAEIEAETASTTEEVAIRGSIGVEVEVETATETETETEGGLTKTAVN
jgi:hypothetical protein